MHGKIVEIDLLSEVVRVGGHEVLRGQWLDFYALLASARNEGPGKQWVTPSELAKLGPWQTKEVLSVRKEVARHLRWLSSRGLRSIVEDVGVTKGWRLATARRELRVRPSEAALREWLESRRVEAEPEERWLRELRVLVDAAGNLSKGRAEKALEQLRRAGVATAGRYLPTFRGWAALLLGTGALQHHDEAGFHKAYGSWAERPGPFEYAVRARLLALAGRANRFIEPERAFRSLSKMAAELERRGDLSSLAVVSNVLGLLMRRRGNTERAIAYHRRAVSLCGVCRDYRELQGAIFNLAICHKEILDRSRARTDARLLEFVDLCRHVCDTFKVGDDSIQNEIYGALWASELGQMTRMRRYLRTAERNLRSIDSRWEQATFLAARARMEQAHGSALGDRIRDLKAAERLFREAGDEESAVKTRERLRTIEAKKRH